MMEIGSYIARMKIFYASFHKYIESDSNSPEEFQEFVTFVNNNQFGNNSDELRSLLHIIHKISNHHKQTTIFKQKICQILLHYIDQIKQTFSNSDIFSIFKGNRFILSFLFDNKIITADEQIAYNLINKFGKTQSNFFYPEIKPFLTQNSGKYILRVVHCDEVDDTDFLQKRKEGQNDSYVCQLIRNDSIDEFQKFLKENDMNFNDLIPDSIFESNTFLAKNQPTFIEYAAFYGSKKIFEFLQNEVGLTLSLWPYAIYGSNTELIELLRNSKFDSNIPVNDICFVELIKCHQNEIAKSFSVDEAKVLQKDQIFCFYNFECFPNDLNDFGDELILEYSCQYDYVTIVKILLQTGKIQLREMLEKSAILKTNFFFIKFVINFFDEIR